MVTHFLSNEAGTVKLYRLPASNSFSINVNNNTNVEVLSEYEGNECSYNRIQIDNKIYYVSIDDVKRLPNTPQSAPYVCFKQFTSNFTEPNWFELELGIPYYNPSDKTYNIPILTEHKNISNKDKFVNDSIKIGIKNLLIYYYKDYSDTNIEKLLSYFKFAYLKDYYVRPINNARIKSLVSVPKKYFDAVPTIEKVVGFENDMQVFNLSTKNLRDKFLYLKNIMNFYDKQLSASNIEIENFSFTKEYRRLMNFYEKLINLFSINDITLKDDVDETLEIVLDKCGRFFSTSLQENQICKYPLISLINLRNNDYARNIRTLNLLKNIDSLYNVDPCKITISDFINRYIYNPPDVQVGGASSPDISTLDYEKILSFVTSTTQKLNSNSLKTVSTLAAEQQYATQLENAIYELKKFYNLESFYDNEKNIFRDVNFSEDLVRLENQKREGTSYDKFEASLIPNNIYNKRKNRRDLLVSVYNVLTINQFLCKLTPKAIKCLLNLLSTTIGEDSGASLNLSLAATTTYSISEIKDKVFPFLNKEEKQIILSELMEQFCLTNSDLISVLKESKNISKTELQTYSTYSYEALKQLILNEIVI